MTPINHLSETGARKPTFTSLGALIFVGCVWAVMTIAGLVLVKEYGSNTPYMDDWDMVPWMVGEQPVTLTWLWETHNEHRIALPKLMQLALSSVTRRNFVAGMVVNVLGMSLLSLLLIVAARNVRGQVNFSDAFFPLTLLQWGQVQTLLWSFQVQFILSTIFVGILLFLIVVHREQLSMAAGAGAGLCLLALPLCGANGLAFVPALAGWLGYAGLSVRSATKDANFGVARILLVSVAVLAVFLTSVYFVGLRSPLSYSSSVDTWAVVRAALQVLTTSTGQANPWWPVSALLVSALGLSSLFILLRAWQRCREERVRILGLLLFSGGMLSLALGIGFGRSSGDGNAGFAGRFVTLTLPLLCWVYFTWLLYAKPAVASLGQTAFFVLACVLAFYNGLSGLESAQNHWENMRVFEVEARAGMSSENLSKPKEFFLIYPNPEILTERLELWRKAGREPFEFKERDQRRQ